MHSLIIAMASIALVAVITLSVMYYMGSNTSTMQTNLAAKVVSTGGLQIEGALQLYQNDYNGAYPATLSSLVPTYLAALPKPDKSAFISSVQATITSNSWAIDNTNKYISIDGLSLNACKAINKDNNVVLGTDSNADGVPDSASGLKGSFCYGKPSLVAVNGYTFARVAPDGNGIISWAGNNPYGYFNLWDGGATYGGTNSYQRYALGANGYMYSHWNSFASIWFYDFNNTTFTNDGGVIYAGSAPGNLSGGMDGTTTFTIPDDSRYVMLTTMGEVNPTTSACATVPANNSYILNGVTKTMPNTKVVWDSVWSSCFKYGYVAGKPSDLGLNIGSNTMKFSPSYASATWSTIFGLPLNIKVFVSKSEP